MSENSPLHTSYHGWLNLYKPEGVTSAKAVAIVKRCFKVKKVGHAGTLDPMACGILPLAINEATKTVSYAMFSEKSYRFIIKWGEETATGDREGAVTATSEKRPSESEIRHILPQFTGAIEQTPPIFSAIKVNGKRAYDLARSGAKVELKARQVAIHSLQLEKCDQNSAQFFVTCGKGTYIRSLASDIAKALGTTGHVTFLERCAVGKFDTKSAILLENLEKREYKADALLKSIMPIHTVLDDIPVLYGNTETVDKICHGMTVYVNTSCEGTTAFMEEGSQKLIALGQCQAGKFKPSRVFNL